MILISSAFAGEMNSIAHQELLHGETIIKEGSSSEKSEVARYKKVMLKNMEEYKEIIHSIKKEQMQNIHNTKEQNFSLAKPAPQAVIFVSLSMPNLSLKQIINDAAAYHIPVVVRGLVDNSLKKTVTRIFELVKERNKGGILLNPLWFKRYDITAVPACVVTEENNFDVIYGNLRLQKMLELIATNGTTKKTAQDILSKGHR